MRFQRGHRLRAAEAHRRQLLYRLNIVLAPRRHVPWLLDGGRQMRRCRWHGLRRRVLLFLPEGQADLEGLVLVSPSTRDVRKNIH